jgi:4-amino-4-deoxy-L-arabinose transferase-like glycosyltransferase
LGRALNPVDATLVLLLWGVVCLLFWDTLHAGEFWWTDESRHAMNGVFFFDFWRDMPRRPYDYALQYFAQYPALALNWYPPFFPVVESLFFALFGISEVGARLTVLLFTLAGVTAWYAWTQPVWGRSAAVVSCLLYLSVPGTIDWARSVMLEAPAVAMIIASVLAFDRYLDRPTLLRSGLTGILLGCMLLLKQTTVFILPALLAYACLTGRKSLLWRKEAVLPYIIVSLVAALLAVHALKFGSVPVNSLVDLFSSSNSQLFTLSRWTEFWPALWAVCGFPLVLAILVGIAGVRIKKTPQDLLILFWFAGSCLFTTIVIGDGTGNGSRYMMYALPALTLLACKPLSRTFKKSNVSRIAFVLLGALATFNVYSAWAKAHPFVTGYQQAAEFVAQQPDSGLILFAGKHDGNFIFHLRAVDPERNKAVVRADKILVSMAVHKSFGMVSYVQTTEDILALIDRFGIGTIVIESRDIVDFPEFKLLTQTVSDDRFQMIKEIPIVTNVPEFSNLSLRVYRYLEKKEQEGDVVIPLPHSGMEIKLKPRMNSR